MEDVRNTKEVDFAKYCKTCKFSELPEYEDPYKEQIKYFSISVLPSADNNIIKVIIEPISKLIKE